MNLLTEENVAAGLSIDCRLAADPTSVLPSSVKATTEGVINFPSEFGMRTGLPPSNVATAELVVPYFNANVFISSPVKEV